MVDYYNRRYIPNNICFVIVGDVHALTIYDQLSQFFAAYPRKTLEQVLVNKEPRQLGMNIRRDTFRTELSRLNMIWKGPGTTDPDSPALEILTTIFGSGTSSLLNQEIREHKKLAYQVGAGFYGLSGDEGLIYAGALAEPSKRDSVEAEILNQVDVLLKKGVSSKELEKVYFLRYYSCSILHENFESKFFYTKDRVRHIHTI